MRFSHWFLLAALAITTGLPVGPLAPHRAEAASKSKVQDWWKWVSGEVTRLAKKYGPVLSLDWDQSSRSCVVRMSDNKTMTTCTFKDFKLKSTVQYRIRK